MTQTYLFYDIETTGLNKAFDQVLQFAAIRTDLQLNEIERYEIKVKLNRDMIPSPQALITHHIGIHASHEGLNEFDAIKKIHQLLNHPGTLSVGYNTLGFDDEFLRFSFYRNLLPPYTHQYANQCGRMDIYPMAIMYFLFKKNIIEWPENSFKLEKINEINQLVSGRAHDAMVDVEATLALARKFFQEKEVWNYLSGYFTKSIDDKRTQQIADQSGLMVYGKIGFVNSFLSPVIFLGNHRHYKNQSLWLRLDTENLQQTTTDNIQENTWVFRKKSAEPGFILPSDEKYLKHLSDDRKKLSDENNKWLHNHSDIFQKIKNHHAEFKYPVFENVDAEACLYVNGFLSFEDEKFCRQFHAGSISDKVRLTDQIKNPTLKSLATRIIARHFPSDLSPQQTDLFAEFLKQPSIIDYRGEARMSAKKALGEIAVVRQQSGLSDEQLNLLKELEAHLHV
jgi:exodeoxyribonuclease-1